jgi:hypothetical protein
MLLFISAICDISTLFSINERGNNVFDIQRAIEISRYGENNHHSTQSGANAV